MKIQDQQDSKIENADIAEDLFKSVKNHISLVDYIHLLKNKNKLRYLTLNDFCNKIRQVIKGQDAEQFIFNFQRQFIRYRQINHDQVNYHFPFVDQNDNKLLEITMTNFIVQYHFEEDNYQGNNFKKSPFDIKQPDPVNPSSYEEESPYNIKEKPIDYKKFLLFLDRCNHPNVFNILKTINPYQTGKTILDQSISLHFDYDFKPWRPRLMPKMKQIQQPIKNPLNQNKCQDHFSSNRNKIIDINTKFEKYKIPDYFLARSKAVRALIGINFTSYFAKQLKQIKKLIKGQINTSQITQEYEHFLIEYMQYKQISEGKYDQEFKDYEQELKDHINQMQKYYSIDNLKIQYGFDCKESMFLNTWKKICLQIKKKYNDPHLCYSSEVKQHLLKGLQQIYLVFYLSMPRESRLYGSTVNMAININVNVIDTNLSFQEFRQGPLKPYITLTLYHELTHFLIKSFKQAEVDSSATLFNNQSETIGSQILKLAQRSYNHIPKYLRIKSLIKFDRLKRQSRIKEFTQKIYQFIHKQPIFFFDIKLYSKKLDKLKQKILIIGNCFERLQDKVVWTEQKLEEVFKYIEKLLIFQQKVKKFDIVQELKYKYLISVFLTPEIMIPWLNFVNLNIQDYKILREKLIIKKTINVYCIQRNKVIDQFFFSIIGKTIVNQQEEIQLISKLENQQRYVDLVLEQNITIESVNQEISTILSKFNADLVTKQFGDINILFLSLANLFKNFKLSTKLEQNDNLDSFIDRTYKTSIITLFRVKQSYEMLMNFVKYSQLLEVCYSVPSFFTHGMYDKGSVNDHQNQVVIKRFGGKKPKYMESGFDIERRLFPNLLQHQEIYSKDYHLFKMIFLQENRKKVGQRPENNEERRQYVSISKSGEVCQRGLNIGNRECSHLYIRLTRNQKKQLRDEKMKKFTHPNKKDE